VDKGGYMTQRDDYAVLMCNDLICDFIRRGCRSHIFFENPHEKEFAEISKNLTGYIDLEKVFVYENKYI